MNKELVTKALLNVLQTEYSDKKFGEKTQEEVVDSIYAVLEELLPQDEYTDEQISKAIDIAIQGVFTLENSSEEVQCLYQAMYDAETKNEIEFSAEDVDYLQSIFTQTEFTEGSDVQQEAYNIVNEYLAQNKFSFLPSNREIRAMGRDVRKAGEELGILAKRSPMQRLKLRLSPKRSVTKTAWDTAKDITTSPLGRVAIGSGVQGIQMKALNGIQSRVNMRNAQVMHASGAELVNDLFTEAEEVVAARNAEAQARADEETIAKTPIPLEKAPLANNSKEENLAVGHTENPIPDATPQDNTETSKDFVHEVEKNLDLHDDASKTQAAEFAEEAFNGIQSLYAFFWKPKEHEEAVGYLQQGGERGEKISPLAMGKGGYYGRENGTIGVGTLGTGAEYRSWRANLPKNARGGIKFETNMLTGAMVDAITEGLLAGTYYQSLDTGLQVSSGTIKTGYKGLKALITPTLDKAQEKLERSGNKMANWALPEGPSPVDIIGMDGKDAQEVIKVLDQTNYLNKLPEQARTLFLINLSKSGICYIDEKGTLTKRTIVDKLVNTYAKNPDEFLEILPGELENIKELYQKNALVSKESINTDQIYNRLKDAKSVEQVRQILTDELNVVKKPMTSLSDLVASISNDFITLMKTDKRQFKYIINRIARDVEVMARKNGEDSLSAISRAFLRNLAAASNEIDIRRTVEKLVIANIKYLNDLLDVKTGTFAEQEIDVEGGNVNMENSPVKSTGNRTGLTPSNIGQTAGWTEKEQEEGDTNSSTATLEEAKDKALDQKHFSIDEHFTQTSFAQGQSSEQVSAPGFGVSAYLNL